MILSTLDKSRKGGAYEQIPSLVFCHYNGYPDDNGAILAEHYDKQEKVESLIQLGDLYFLCGSGWEHQKWISLSLTSKT